MDKIDKLCKMAQGIISLDEAISMEEDGSQLCLDCKEAQGWGDSDGHSTPCEICGGERTIGSHWLIVSGACHD